MLESMNELGGWRGRRSARGRGLLLASRPSLCHLPPSNIAWLLPGAQDAVGAPASRLTVLSQQRKELRPRGPGDSPDRF